MIIINISHRVFTDDTRNLEATLNTLPKFFLIFNLNCILNVINDLHIEWKVTTVNIYITLGPSNQ